MISKNARIEKVRLQSTPNNYSQLNFVFIQISFPLKIENMQCLIEQSLNTNYIQSRREISEKKHSTEINIRKCEKFDSHSIKQFTVIDQFSTTILCEHSSLSTLLINNYYYYIIGSDKNVIKALFKLINGNIVHFQ